MTTTSIVAMCIVIVLLIVFIKFAIKSGDIVSRIDNNPYNIGKKRREEIDVKKEAVEITKIKKVIDDDKDREVSNTDSCNIS